MASEQSSDRERRHAIGRRLYWLERDRELVRRLQPDYYYAGGGRRQFEVWRQRILSEGRSV